MDPDPQMAKAIADKVAATASDYVGDIMEMVPPKLIEDGEVPLLKTSPSNTKNALIGGFLGVLLGVRFCHGAGGVKRHRPDGGGCDPVPGPDRSGLCACA